MSAKAAERLIILGDHCRGLLARVYNLHDSVFKTPETLDADVERVLKKLVSKFPDNPPDLDKTPGHDIFQKRAQKITADLQDYYLTYVDILNFNGAAYDLLEDLSKNIVAFKFHINPDLMTHFMDLFTGYVQLHLLATRSNQSKRMLSAYARAYQLTHGNTEPNYSQIAKYIKRFETAPVAQLREQVSSLSLTVGETVSSFMDGQFMPVTKWFDKTTFVQKNLFGVLDDPSNLTRQKHIADHLELLHLDRFIHWSLYGLLMCPQALQKDNAMQLLKVCLQSTFVVPIYRDQMLNIHEEFEVLFGSYKLNKFKLSKHKSVLKEAYNDAIGCVKRHADFRTYLRVELEGLLHFFTEFPQLLAPKFQMVLAILRLARNEVLWYFRHLDVQPWKTKKFTSREEFQDDRVSELIYLIDSLVAIVDDNRNYIEQYYVDFLRGPDIKQLQPTCEKFIREVKLTQGVQELLSDIVNSVANATIEDDFEAIRLNWYRASAQLNSQQSGVGTKAHDINREIILILVHSRNVDRIGSQLKNHASLRDLFWYRKPLHQILMHSLSALDGQPRHCMAIVRLLNAGLQNVHRNCPEEQRFIGTKSVASAELFFDAIVTALGSLLSGIIQKVSTLRKQTLPIEVVNRHQRAAQHSKNKNGEPLPGFESVFVNRSVMHSLATWKKSVAEICAAIRETERLVIFNTEFSPREWLYSTVKTELRKQVRAMAMTEKAIQRPSILLTQVKDLIHVFQHIDSHVNINLSDVVREVLLTEFSGSSGQSQVGSPAVGEEESKAPCLIKTIGMWYKQLIGSSARSLYQLGVTYSPIKQGFVRLPGNSKAFPAENYADLSELKALCTLAGPGGVRVIDRLLLQTVTDNVEKIKQCLALNQKTLQDLSGHYFSQEVWSDKVKQLRGMSELVNVSVVIGGVLKFRKLLRTALRHVVQDQVPFIAQTVTMLYGVSPKNTTMDPRFTAVDYLAQDIGVDAGSADHSLTLALRQYKADQADEDLWSLLPELYASSFMQSPLWQKPYYCIETESHKNNVHCIATTVHKLIVTFTSINLSTLSGQQTEQNINQHLERFARCASYSILHMASPKMSDQYSDFKRDHIMVFIEQFVKETNGRLHLSMLEEFFPFTLMRTNYVQLYERQDKTGRSYAAVIDEDEKQQQ